MKINGVLRRGFYVAVFAFMALLYLAVRFTESVVLKELSLKNLFLAVISGLSVLFCEGIRFYTTSRILKSKFISFIEAINISFVGMFFARLTPSGAGGEPFQIYLMSKRGVSSGEATAMILVNSVNSMVARVCLLIMVPIILLLYSSAGIEKALIGEALFLAFISGLIFISLLLYIFLHPQVITVTVQRIIKSFLRLRLLGTKRVESWLKSTEEFTEDFKKLSAKWNKKDWLFIIISFFLILLGWFFTALIPFHLLRGFKIPVTFPMVFLLTIIMRTTTDFIPMPGSVGVQEIGLIAFFKPMITTSYLWAFVFAWRVIFYYLPLILTSLVAVNNFLAVNT